MEKKFKGFRPLAGRTLSVTACAVPALPKGELLQLPLPCTKLSLRESWRAAPERVFAGINCIQNGMNTFAMYAK